MGPILSEAIAPHAPKVWRQRVCTPEDSLARLRPHRARMGITRVADVTGLDRIGIPVAQAIRPMGRSLSVAQGKGVTLAAAMVSATMEAAEGWHAENVSLPLRTAPLAALDQDFDLDGLAVKSPLPRDVPLELVPGTILGSGAKIWVPLAFVSKDFTVPAPLPQFARSTNGLASGNTLAEAQSAALHEVIERDCHADFTHLPEEAQRVRLRGDPWIAACGADVIWLVDQIKQAGLWLFVSDITNDLGVPCVHARLIDANGPGTARATRPTYGVGCHLDPAIATARAITEAVQSRLTQIAGSRDDLGLRRYVPASDGNVVSTINAAMDLAALQPQQRPPASAATASAQSDVEALCDLLTGHGLSQIGIVDLSRPDLPLHVVRALVPGLGQPLAGTFTRGTRHGPLQPGPAAP